MIRAVCEADARALNERYWDLSFVSDIRGCKCTRCGRVAIQHQIASCGHLYCRKCKERFDDSQGFKCSDCGQTITHMTGEDVQIEKNIFELDVHCLNYKYGCDQIVPLHQLPGHLKVCKDTTRSSLTSIYKSKNPNDAVVRRLGTLSQSIRNLSENYEQMKTSHREIENNLSEHLINFIRNGFDEIKAQFANDLNKMVRDVHVTCIGNNGSTTREKQMEDINNEIHQIKDFCQTLSTQVQKLDKMSEENKTLKMELEAVKQNQTTSLVNQEQAKHQKYVNVLLLGETGHGKSTLINRFACCHRYKTFAEAVEGKLEFPIKGQKVEGSQDATSAATDEFPPSTLACKSYVFAINDNVWLRWLDCPGLASRMGPNQDAQNAIDIINCIEQYQTIHAMVIVMKGNEARGKDQFVYCLQQWLSMLHKSAVNNITFVFTNTKRTGDTLTTVRACLTKMTKDSKANKSTPLVPTSRQTVYFFDNAIVQNLVNAKQNQKQAKNAGDDEDDDDQEEDDDLEEDWTAVRKEFKRLVDHFLNVKGHQVTPTVNIHRAKMQLQNINMLYDHISNVATEDEQKNSFNHQLNGEKATLTDAIIKFNNFIKHNAIIPKNSKLSDYAKTFNRVSSTVNDSSSLELELDRHLPPDTPEYFVTLNQLEVAEKRILLLDTYAKKFKNICSWSQQNAAPVREKIVSREYSTIL